MNLKRAVTILALVVVATGSLAAVFTNSFREQDAVIDRLTATGPGPLDGMTFHGMLGPDGQPKDVEDTFVFADGTFVSKECELRCEYPPRPYKAEEIDGGWRFESVTRCPYKDATISWNGRISDGRIEGIATWTLRRWYWTIERDFAFEADLALNSQNQAEEE